eukprot:9066757-Pyramimonas_sp.AAC.1
MVSLLAPAAPSGRSEAGTTGGVGIATSKLWGLKGLDDLPVCIAVPPGCRFRLGLWSGLCSGGVLVGSVYLHTGIGCR